MRILTKKEFEKSLEDYQKYSVFSDIEKNVSKILQTVRAQGDRALQKYEKKFDHVNFKIDEFEVKDSEMKEAFLSVPDSFLKTIKKMIKRVENYQKKLLTREWIKKYEDKRLGSLVRSLDCVGIYIPGGTAPLVSTVIMSVVPAKVANVKKIIVTTPPNKEKKVNPYILVACKLTGVDRIFKLGGAQAIAAMAFGTKTVPKVDKIAGPGNIYVASAKRQVFGYVGIDMVAGPSEIMIIADERANAKYIAADLLSQAEHDAMARTFLVTNSKKLAEEVRVEVKNRINKLKRSKTARLSIQKNSFVITVKNIDEAIEIANKIAPEHLEIKTKEPSRIVENINNAGAVFIGEYTPEPVGDYIAGPSHVLPTGGTARFFSPLSTRDFQKTISYIEYSRKALKKDLNTIREITDIEGLDAHQKSAEVRFL